jgi:hypothetical protein
MTHNRKTMIRLRDDDITASLTMENSLQLENSAILRNGGGMLVQHMLATRWTTSTMISKMGTVKYTTTLPVLREKMSTNVYNSARRDTTEAYRRPKRCRVRLGGCHAVLCTATRDAQCSDDYFKPFWMVYSLKPRKNATLRRGSQFFTLLRVEKISKEVLSFGPRH